MVIPTTATTGTRRRNVPRIVEAWGGPRDGEQFAIITSGGKWDSFPDGYYSLATVERRQHHLVRLRVMLRWHQESVHT